MRKKTLLQDIIQAQDANRKSNKRSKAVLEEITSFLKEDIKFENQNQQEEKDHIGVYNAIDYIKKNIGIQLNENNLRQLKNELIEMKDSIATEQNKSITEKFFSSVSNIAHRASKTAGSFMYAVADHTPGLSTTHQIPNNRPKSLSRGSLKDKEPITIRSNIFRDNALKKKVTPINYIDDKPTNPPETKKFTTQKKAAIDASISSSRSDTYKESLSNSRASSPDTSINISEANEISPPSKVPAKKNKEKVYCLS